MPKNDTDQPEEDLVNFEEYSIDYDVANPFFHAALDLPYKRLHRKTHRSLDVLNKPLKPVFYHENIPK